MGGGGPKAQRSWQPRPERQILAASCLKAALDADWDDPATADHALAQVLVCLDAVQTFLAGHLGEDTAAAAVAVAAQVRDQDIDFAGQAPTLRRGVAAPSAHQCRRRPDAPWPQVPIGAL